MVTEDFIILTIGIVALIAIFFLGYLVGITRNIAPIHDEYMEIIRGYEKLTEGYKSTVQKYKEIIAAYESTQRRGGSGNIR